LPIAILGRFVYCNAACVCPREPLIRKFPVRLVVDSKFVTYYNNRRCHESLDNLTPADVYFGRGPTILKRRESIERKTIQQRRRLHQQAIAA
jgi:hypothetical protein